MNNLKILVCTSEYPPNCSSGIGNVAYNVVEQLKKQGVQCVVCSPNGDVKVGNSKMIDKFGIIGLLYYWHSVSKYFKDNDFDVAWLHNPLFLRKNPFQKSVVTIHSTYYGKMIRGVRPKIYNNISSKIERYCLNRMPNARFTGVGTNICDELEEIGIDEKRMTYIPNGVNTNKFKPASNKSILRKRLGISDDSLIILSVGRLTYIKQPQQLLEVFSMIEKKIGNMTLVFAGKGELFNELKEYATNQNITSVKFLGHVSYDILPDFCAASDYYIIASKYEGGEPVLTLAEAMASGLPSIVSNIENFKFIEEVKAGIVVDFSNIEKAAEAIVEYLNIDNSDHSLNARNYVAKNFEWRNIAERYLDEFKKLF